MNHVSTDIHYSTFKLNITEVFKLETLEVHFHGGYRLEQRFCMLAVKKMKHIDY